MIFFCHNNRRLSNFNQRNHCKWEVDTNALKLFNVIMIIKISLHTLTKHPPYPGLRHHHLRLSTAPVKLWPTYGYLRRWDVSLAMRLAMFYILSLELPHGGVRRGERVKRRRFAWDYITSFCFQSSNMINLTSCIRIKSVDSRTPVVSFHLLHSRHCSILT